MDADEREHFDRFTATAKAGAVADRLAPAFPPIDSEFWRAPSRPISWHVRGWMQAHKVSILAGKGGSGKTKLAAMLTAATAAGRTVWLPGGPPLDTAGPGKVVFASWENTRDEFRLMLTDWPDAQGDARDTLPDLLGDRLAFRDLAGLGPLWTADNGTGRLSDLGARLRDDAGGAALLVIDPLAAAYGDNENDRVRVRAFMADWQSWAADAQCTVLILAHPPKSEADWSGSTDWHAAARAMWTLGIADGDTRLECIKVNAGPKPEPLRLDHWTWWRATPWDASDAGRESAILDTLRQLDEPLAKSKLATEAPGNKQANLTAIDRLYETGQLTRKAKGTGHAYSLPE